MIETEQMLKKFLLLEFNTTRVFFFIWRIFKFFIKILQHLNILYRSCSSYASLTVTYRRQNSGTESVSVSFHEIKYTYGNLSNANLKRHLQCIYSNIYKCSTRRKAVSLNSERARFAFIRIHIHTQNARLSIDFDQIRRKNTLFLFIKY